MKKLSRITSLLIVLLTGYGVESASALGISGIVRDIATKAVIPGAVVSDGTNSTTSNSKGAYALDEAPGRYTLTITKSGYLTTTQRATVRAGAINNVTVNWALTKSYGTQAIPAANMQYVILAWNDLGMHCDQDDYSYFGVLPPFNTLHAQVIRRGEDASLANNGIIVTYRFPKKTNSALHTNFWTYAPQFGWNVPTNVGITGTRLAGRMKRDAKGLGWVAEGIPITPYDDDGTWNPYGTAIIAVRDGAGTLLQTANVVAPVSTEMLCSNCHGTTNPQLDILEKHDALSATTLVADQAQGIVHLCAECHADNAIGAAGKPGVPNLSLAMHNFHKDKMTATSVAAGMKSPCYNCHPGLKTQCLRGIMMKAGKTCINCHGGMTAMATSIQNGRQPWLEEPRCGACHDAKHAENANTLYRNSVLTNAVDGDMKNIFYCEACHNSTHAEWTTKNVTANVNGVLKTLNAADSAIPRKFQGDNYWIWNCTVCHNGIAQKPMHK